MLELKDVRKSKTGKPRTITSRFLTLILAKANVFGLVRTFDLLSWWQRHWKISRTLSLEEVIGRGGKAAAAPLEIGGRKCSCRDLQHREGRTLVHTAPCKPGKTGHCMLLIHSRNSRSDFSQSGQAFSCCWFHHHGQRLLRHDGFRK